MGQINARIIDNIIFGYIELNVVEEYIVIQITLYDS